MAAAVVQNSKFALALATHPSKSQHAVDVNKHRAIEDCSNRGMLLKNESLAIYFLSLLVVDTVREHRKICTDVRF